MNEIINKFLLAGDKFMPEMHLRQPGFTYSPCGPFTKNKERIKKNWRNRRLKRYIYQNEPDKACFKHDMAYENFKDLLRRTASDKVLRDKAFNIATNPKYHGYQRGLASMDYNFFDKKTSGANTSGGAVKSEIMWHQELAKELPKPIIRKFEKKGKYANFL